MTDVRPWSGFESLVSGLAGLQTRAREAAARSVDEILTTRSWLIGAWIIAFEQEGADRARYGDGLIDALATAFKARGVSGLSARNLRNCRQIALTWPGLGIRQTPSANSQSKAAKRLPSNSGAGASGPSNHQTLSGELARAAREAFANEMLPALPARSDALAWQDEAWMRRLRTELCFSHLLELSRIEDAVARAFYELQALKERWSVRELVRQRNAMLFERVGLSRDKDAVLALANEGRLLETPKATLRDPYVLEFLGLETRATYGEAELEAALIAHLHDFLLELGGDFAFMGRQYRITVGGRHHFIDLLFYHRRLRCLVAIDLKIGSFGYEDAGQMNFYLNYLRDNVSLADENPPVGLVLCADKDVAEVHYATGHLDQQVFVSRYLTRLPSEEQLRKWLDEEREVLARAALKTGN